MKNIIIGTAGHIDHGKTALIKALTGVDTDRLKEEKERGITIELGFASLSLPNGLKIGIVDVPGHEKFVKHMVSGVGGIDILLLIIAADEGVMPQTKEHLDICQLLQIKKGIVVVTKKDLAEDDWLELVIADIRELVKGTFIENAPIIQVSSVTGDGLPDLLSTIENLSKDIKPKSTDGIFRLPIDRIFTIKGFGTVITGTSLSGKIKVGDTVEILPIGTKARIRGIQVHNQLLEEAFAGQRTALNIQGMEKSQFERGFIMVTPNSLKPVFMIDARLNLLSNAPKTLTNRTRVRFHTGTAEIMGRIILLDKEKLLPGESGLVQIRLENHTAVMPKDNFVIRSYSPTQTIAGGEILDAQPKKHKRFVKKIIDDLLIIEKGTDEEIVNLLILNAHFREMNLNEIWLKSAIKKHIIKELVENLVKKEKIILIEEDSVMHIENYTRLKEMVCTTLKTFHRQYPLKDALPKEELKSKMPPEVNSKAFSHLLNKLHLDRQIIMEKDIIRLSSHRIQLKSQQEDIKKKIEDIYFKADFQPPATDEIIQKLSLNKKESLEIIQLLIREGILIKLKDNLIYHKDCLTKIKTMLIVFLKENKEITLAQLKDLLQLSRKYLIPLVEHFDNINLTMRVGDKRVLRKG